MRALLELASRCEKATGPSFVLDQEIGTATGQRLPTLPAKPFTASLDAAMTLVPEGCWFSVDGGACNPLASCHPADSREVSDLSRGTTPALALCAAALRARANQGDQA